MVVAEVCLSIMTTCNFWLIPVRGPKYCFGISWSSLSFLLRKKGKKTKGGLLQGSDGQYKAIWNTRKVVFLNSFPIDANFTCLLVHKKPKNMIQVSIKSAFLGENLQPEVTNLYWMVHRIMSKTRNLFHKINVDTSTNIIYLPSHFMECMKFTKCMP